MPETIKIYYQDYDSDESMESDDEYMAPLYEAREIFEGISETDGNFFGLELESGEILQFMHDENRGLVLDIPVTAEGGSYTKVTDMASALQYIGEMYSGKKPRDIEGLVFESY